MRILLAASAASVLLVAGCATPDRQDDAASAPNTASSASTPSMTATSHTPRGPVRPQVVRTVADGLAVPWGITFLPDGTALVGERDSTRVLALDDGRPREVGRVAIAVPQGEAGLLGLAASPSYAEDHLVYAYVSTATDNRVVRMTYDGGRLGSPEPVLTGIPNGFIHDGGRLLFAPDGTLFVSTGETGEEQLAQDPDSLAGKILRLTPDGASASVWSLGHRNVQGLAFDDRGRLWASEFGANAWDELNLVEKGRNYGWPFVEGRGDLDRFANPVRQWRTSEASPSGLAFLDGSLWLGSLRGQRLWQVPLSGGGPDGTAEPRAWFVGDYGRLRTVQVTPEGRLWVTTSNRDGRGDPAPEDDRILEIALR